MQLFSTATKKMVVSRANHLCEYCCALASYSVQPFVIEHILPISKNGTNDLENLAYACGGCNGSKYNKTHSIDPISTALVPLFNPREMTWDDHFVWSEDFIEMLGVSSTGRATIETLQLNRNGVKNLRKLLIRENLHPPF